MTPRDARRLLKFATTKGDAAEALCGLVADVVCRLPGYVRDWLLDVEHVWVFGIADTFGSCCVRRARAGQILILYLSDRVLDLPRAEQEFVVAHEIAHGACAGPLRRTKLEGDVARERAADNLAEFWGFPVPPWRRQAMRKAT